MPTGWKNPKALSHRSRVIMLARRLPSDLRSLADRVQATREGILEKIAKDFDSQPDLKMVF